MTMHTTILLSLGLLLLSLGAQICKDEGNTLLKSELERERIVLELEEEKKAHVEREKRLQEQAKKIEN